MRAILSKYRSELFNRLALICIVTLSFGDAVANAQSNAESAVELLGPPACDFEVLSSVVAPGSKYDVILGDAKLFLYGMEAPAEMSAPNTNAMDFGIAELLINSDDGRLNISHSMGNLTSIGTFDGSAEWEWEEAAGLVAPSPDWSLQEFGCRDGKLPRWTVSIRNQMGSTDLELVMQDSELIFGNLTTIGGNSAMQLKATRPITFLLQ